MPKVRNGGNSGGWLQSVALAGLRRKAEIQTEALPVDGRKDICRVDIAAVVWRREAADFVEPLGFYPEPLMWAVAAQVGLQARSFRRARTG
jgi:hypothetical protein